MRLTGIATGLALLALTGCLGTPEDAASYEDLDEAEQAVLAASGDAYTNTIWRKIGGTNSMKCFELGRVDPGSPVTVTRVPGADNSGSFKFDVEFAAANKVWATPANGSCANSFPVSSSEQSCTRTSDPAQPVQYARACVTASNGASGAFGLKEVHIPVKDDDRHSHYASDVTSVRSWDSIDRHFVGLSAEYYFGALQFQRVEVKIVRSGSAVQLDRLNGPKLKSINPGNVQPNVEIADLNCPRTSNGNFVWSSNTITCVLASAPSDGELHIPLSRTPGTNPTATVTIKRTSPETAGTATVRASKTATDLVSFNMSPKE